MTTTEAARARQGELGTPRKSYQSDHPMHLVWYETQDSYGVRGWTG